MDKMNLLEIITQLTPPRQDEMLDRFAREKACHFKAILELHPVTNRTSSMCNSDAFWLFFLTGAIDPAVVVESGSYLGFSTCLLHRAVPDAQLFSFDPNVVPAIDIPNYQHFKCDWLSHLLTLGKLCRGKTTLAFFDDHVDHELRLFQARQVGIKHLVFHDNYLTPYHSHLPIRFVNSVDIADFYFEFPPLLAHHDPIFADGARRWLTYVRLK
jgi:hypothetical protein